jgi:hypothetical protein
MEDGRPGTQQQPGEPPDDELTIPRAAMNKMIKELLPNIRVANEAREVPRHAASRRWTPALPSWCSIAAQSSST